MYLTITIPTITIIISLLVIQMVRKLCQEGPEKIKKEEIICVDVEKDIFPILHSTLTSKPNMKENNPKVHRKLVPIQLLKEPKSNFKTKL